MKSKINYYILIPKTNDEIALEGFINLNKAAKACSKAVKEVGDAFGRVAKILRDDKFYKAVYEANEYIKEQEKTK